MPKILFRSPSDIDIPKHIKDAAKKQLGLPSSIEAAIEHHPIEEASYLPEPSLLQCYQNRVNSLHQAMMFILKAYPPNAVTSDASTTPELERYFKFCLENTHFPPHGRIALYQEKLTCFTTDLLNALIDYWAWEPGQELSMALDCLNKAEQYCLLKLEPENTATIHPFTANEQHYYIVQYDEYLPGMNETTLEELKKIKATSEIVIPDWFRHLCIAFKHYLYQTKEASPAALLLDVRAVKDAWSYLSKDSGALLHDLEFDVDSTMGRGIRLSANATLLYGQMTSCAHGVSLKDLEAFEIFLASQNATSTPCFIEQLTQIRAHPIWYVLLPSFEQAFLKQLLSEKANLQALFFRVSSRLRTLPVLPNFAAHSLLVLNARGEQVCALRGRLRSSHLASRDLIHTIESVKLDHCSNNLSTLMTYTHQSHTTARKPILLQGLVSPLKYLKDLIPDYALEHDRSLAVRQFQEKEGWPIIFITNHPLNRARWLMATASDDKQCLALLRYARSSDHPALPLLVEKYDAALSSAVGTGSIFDYYGRELYLSSLEQLIVVTLGGVVHGSCVSGKDRKALELMHTDAMFIYSTLYHKWPDLSDGPMERHLFCDLFKSLFLTYHHHHLAHHNAPGAAGIKTPHLYLPKDLIETIEEASSSPVLMNGDILASNNDVDNIGEFSAFVKAGYAKAFNSALKLGKSAAEELLELIGQITANRDFWRRQHRSPFGLFDSVPQGIAEIQRILEKSYPSNIHCIAAIFLSIQQRPMTGSGRSAATSCLYSALLTLRMADDPKATYERIKAELLDEFFDHSTMVCAKKE